MNDLIIAYHLSAINYFNEKVSYSPRRPEVEKQHWSNTDFQ
jgi:hypothetical protein